MALTQEVTDKVAALINAKWKNKNCHLCGSNSWMVNGYITVGIGDDPISQTLGGKVFPCVVVICSNCGDVHLINGIVAGLVAVPELVSK